MMLSEELIMFIKQNVNDYTSLSNLKMSCIYFNKSVTQFSLAREQMHDKIDVYKNIRYCININCKKDTEEFYRPLVGRWIENCHAQALNIGLIKINHKYYNTCSPYCKECFIKNILISICRKSICVDLKKS